MIPAETLKNLRIIFSRYIVIFGGEYGRCKSLSLAALCFYECIISKRNRIISNMPLNYPTDDIKIFPLLETGQFDFDSLSSAKGSIILWDEMFNDVKARSAMTEKNKYVTQMGVGFRKDDIRLRGSLQFFDTLEKMIAQMLEMVIIPTFVNKYSDDAQKDHEMRMSARDFWVDWKCIDKRQNTEFNVRINLFPQLSWYNTNFKPSQLLVSHKEYLDKLEIKSKTKYEDCVSKICRERKQNMDIWLKGLEEIL